MKPEIKFQKLPLKQLIPYARNSRTHSDEQVAQIAASIREFGFNNPVLIDEGGGIIAGHGRVMAARKLNIDTVPCIILSHLSENQKRAYIIADNKIALNAGWDQEMLLLELEALKDADFDLELSGFSEKELLELFKENNAGLTDPDDVPEKQSVIINQPGNVWLLDNHRLLCGDASVAENVKKLLGKIKPTLMVTDPPYGVNYDAKWRVKYDGSKRHALGKVENDSIVDWSNVFSLVDCPVAYVWHAGIFSKEVAESLQKCDFKIISQIIWVKPHFVLSRGDYHWRHEPCWYAVKKNSKHNWNGDRKQDTVWEIQSKNGFIEGDNEGDKERTIHSTQKPVECMKRPIENNTSPGQAVFEPFCGSGTTIIASEQSGRCCFAMELNPQYCDVIIRRWQNFTGKQAILESDGKTFEEIENATKKNSH
ncbi:MAG: site-specific DNA-methyltransferase [Candidatus Riflebacteria bacterium]|nr:site-specific DNA-methyltransferase [Candidatus Riflebacteria bacterium]